MFIYFIIYLKSKVPKIPIIIISRAALAPALAPETQVRTMARN